MQRNLHGTSATGTGILSDAGDTGRPKSRTGNPDVPPTVAVPELLVHVQRHRIPPDLVLLSIEIPETLPAETWPVPALPPKWRVVGADRALKHGDRWLGSKRAAVLRVPSAVLPQENNAVLNPAHPFFAAIRITASIPLAVDRRLLARRAAAAGGGV